MQDYWIERPYIDRNLFRYHIAIINNFADTYNDDKPLKEHIRVQHINLFMQFLHLAKEQMDRNNRILDETPKCLRHHASSPYKIHTNRKQLADRYHVNGSTIWRLIDRMITAGMILGKINHGSLLNFELLISPEMMLIWDRNNPDFLPSSKFLNTENRGFQKPKATTCTPITIGLKEHSNNKIINVNAVVLDTSDSFKEQIENTLKRTQKDDEGFSQMQENFDECLEQKEQTPTTLPPAPDFSVVCTRTETGFMGKYKLEFINAPQVVSRERFVYALANWFVAYLLSSVFKGRNIYQGEINRTVEYVAQYWFSETECFDRDRLIQRSQVLAWCADAAARYTKRSGFNMANIYPRAFVDRGNTGCSLHTVFSKWFKKSYEYYRNKKNQQPLLRDRKLMHETMQKFVKNQTLDEYRRGEAYVKKAIPHLLPEFYSHFIKPKVEEVSHV